MSCIPADPPSPRRKSPRSWQKCTKWLLMLFPALDSGPTLVVARQLALPLCTIPWTSSRSLNLNIALPWLVFTLYLCELLLTTVLLSRRACSRRRRYLANSERKGRTEWRKSEVPRRRRLELPPRRYDFCFIYRLHAFFLVNLDKTSFPRKSCPLANFILTMANLSK